MSVSSVEVRSFYSCQTGSKFSVLKFRKCVPAFIFLDNAGRHCPLAEKDFRFQHSSIENNVDNFSWRRKLHVKK